MRRRCRASSSLNGHVERNIGAAAQRREHGLRDSLSQLGPELQRSLGERPFGVFEQGGRIRAALYAQSFAGRAPAQGAVEGEAVRRERLEAASAIGTGQVLAVHRQRPAGFGHIFLDVRHMHYALAERQGRLDAVRDASAQPAFHDDAVHDDFHTMFAAAVDVGWGGQIVRMAVDPDPREAGLAKLLPARLIRLSDFDVDRGQQIQPGAFRLAQQLVDNLVRPFACRSAGHRSGSAVGRCVPGGCGGSRRSP